MCTDKNETQEVDIVRLKVNLNKETAAALQDLSDRMDVSITEVIRRSIGILKFMQDETDAGREIRTRDRKGREKTITLID